MAEAIDGRSSPAAAARHPGRRRTHRTGHRSGRASHVTPYCNRPSQAGLLDHFKACAAATDMPVLLYDIKAHRSSDLDGDDARTLRDVDNIIGVKTPTVIRPRPPGSCRSPADTEVYSGDDPLTLALLATGAVGTIGVATHWIGNETQQMMDAFFGGDIAKAIELNRLMIPSYSFETGDLAPNPIPTKAMLRLMGLPAGRPVRRWGRTGVRRDRSQGRACRLGRS